MNLTKNMITESGQKVLRLAEQMAQEYGNAEYGSEHVLWALMNEDLDLGDVISEIGINVSGIKNWAIALVEKFPKSKKISSVVKGNDRVSAIIDETQKLCIRYGHNEITTLDLLEAIVTPGVAFDKDVIRRLPIALYEIIDYRNSHADSPVYSSSNGSTASSGGGGASPSENRAILEKYCEEMNILGAEGKIDPVIGRDKELKQMVEILGKRISPNVMIVGEPGVGKTSVVEGLVLELLEGNVPDKLKQAMVFSLDVSGRLVAGAFKGEIEERMKSILKAIKDHDGKAILFIDEIHILLDEKGPVGSGVINLLKPELSKGEITIIGATTQKEYQKYIEKDNAFSRRFSKLTIMEPDEISAVKMLSGIVPKYEEFHGLKIDPESVTSSVTLAKKYIKDKHLPASAIELMDFTMSCAVQMNATSKNILERVEMQMKGDDVTNDLLLLDLKNQLSELLVGLLEEEDNDPSELERTLEKLKSAAKDVKASISSIDVEAITAYKSGIPLGNLRSKEQEKLQFAEDIMRKRVVGQDHVVEAVAKGLKTFRTNLKEPNDPGAIFFFTGPTGTGKTEMAKAIAELLFDDEDAMLRFDMSEFQESHSVATLLGAPPGYVGYDEGGILVNNVRKKPYSVVLFDEIEKAHPDIYGIFLQMLTDGRLQDKQGKMADFSNVIVIFTSNAGAHEIVDIFNAGKYPEPEELKGILRASGHFKDEFLGRVDSQILPFKPITEEVARLILNIHLNKFKKLLKKQHRVDFSVTEKVIDHLVEIGFSPIYGARPLKSAIKSFLTPPIANKIIMGEIVKGSNVSIDLDDNQEIIWDIK